MRSKILEEVDVIVIGSGAGGLTTAIVAAKYGLRTIVVEKTEYFGGTTAYSGGGIWIPNNHHMCAIGFSDSREEAVDYLQGLMGDLYDNEKTEAFIDTAPEMLKFMESSTEAKFKPFALPDYSHGVKGWKRGRSLLSISYNMRYLGKYASHLRPQRQELLVFGDMQLEGGDIHQLRKAFRSFRSFAHAARLLLTFTADHVRHGRSRRLVNGNALVGRLLKSAVDSNVVLRRNARAVRLIREGDRVVGVEVESDGKKIQLRARKGVVLATGGYGANPEMRARYFPMAEHHHSLQPEANVGDGLELGVSAGGRIVETNRSNGIWAPVSVMRNADGSQLTLPHIVLDRYMPGSIAVDSSGRRFVNEAVPYQHFVDAMHQIGLSKVHLIADANFLRNYGLGLVRPAPFPIKQFIRNGYLVDADTMQELAAKIEVDAAGLMKTVKRFNDCAVNGIDSDFGRGEDPFTLFRGDPDHKPNPSVAPIIKGPFYAVALYPGDLSTVNGLETDKLARVLDAEGKAIPGLFAVGLDMNSLTRGYYPGGGTSIGIAMTFGYIVGRHLAGNYADL